MCGIAGFIDFTNNSTIDNLKNCTDSLLHRGPDGSGYEFFQQNSFQVALGHRRLAVIDLSIAGNQPMKYKHFWIVFNGEIYNFNELKNELILKGHVFLSHSDTEVVLHCYEEYGPKMVERFIGMFAFVIYDSIKEIIFCCRDRAGVKPFYYYNFNGLFMFASELKAFHRHPQFNKEINLQAVHQYFQYGYIMAPLCIFNHTFKLEPGHYMLFDIKKKQFNTVKYWDITTYYTLPRKNISEEEAVLETEKLLKSACEYRMVSDVPVGVFLSGGYDSTIVTAMLQKDRTEKIKTFSIGFYEEKYNEAHFAKTVAQYIGTEHTEYYCTKNEAQEIIPSIPEYSDEPNADSSIIPTTLVSRLARKNVTVALSADAGDEIFAGYSKYQATLQMMFKIKRVPSSARKMLGNIIEIMPDRLFSILTGKISASNKREVISGLLKSSDTSSADVLIKMLSQNFSDKQLRDIFNLPVSPPESIMNDVFSFAKIESDLDQMLALDYKTYMVSSILTKVDRATMSVSLEGREPLLDHRLVEYVAQLPDYLKMNKGKTKYILKKITHKYVPAAIMDRPKMGFGVPVFEWLKGDLKDTCSHFVNDDFIISQGIFKLDEIQKIKYNYYSGNAYYNGLFWNLLVFQMWYKRWCM